MWSHNRTLNNKLYGFYRKSVIDRFMLLIIDR